MQTMPRGDGPPFDQVLPPDGYLWWYLDAVSDDGRHGLTVIVLLGSVFSPYYASARRRGAAEPTEYCAFNVALYGRPGRWAMTERGRPALQRSATGLRLGPSRIGWRDGALELDIDEITVPWPSRLRGRLRVLSRARNVEAIALDRNRRHWWWPYAPESRVELEFTEPRLSWHGHAYLDSNWGSEPLERGFLGWDWLRATLPDGGSVMLYDRRFSDSEERLAVRFAVDGSLQLLEVPLAEARLPATAMWRIPRATRADDGAAARVRRTLEDTPFYARSMLDTRLLGEPVTAMHESLCLQRFGSRWVQLLLPFRMPRRRAWRSRG
jgi:carotenoid 1,2-hydratase